MYKGYSKVLIGSYSLFVMMTLVFMVSCGNEESFKAPKVEIIHTFSNIGGEPNLHSTESGALYLSWIEHEKGVFQLKFSEFQNRKWLEPKLIATGDNWFVNWADFPSISSFRGNDDHLIAHWLQKSDVGTFDYDVRVSTSMDGGSNWSSSFVIHDDSIAAEHGFVSLLPVNDDRMFISWLDGRNTKSNDYDHAAANHGHHGAMTLRAAEIDIHGKKFYDDEIDPKICDCCQTSAALTSCGPLVVYRDRSDKEVRDIYITRKDQDGWTAPKAVHHDNWKINGCPVNGPSVIASDRRVVVAWFTMDEDISYVKLAFSYDCGDNFTLPIRIDNGDPMGRVDLLEMEDGDVLVSWVEAENDQAHIMLARINENQEIKGKWPIVPAENSRRSGFPRMGKYGNNVIMTWTAFRDNNTFVKSAIIDL